MVRQDNVGWYKVMKFNPAPGASYLRCDWCAQEHRRWFLQRVCTNCVVAPRGAYSKRLMELVLWGLACATCGTLGWLAAWVTMR